jgi:hypothetical protein
METKFLTLKTLHVLSKYKKIFIMKIINKSVGSSNQGSVAKDMGKGRVLPFK